MDRFPTTHPLAAALLGVGLAACSGGGCSSGDDRPHVLLLTVDTLRADRLGAHGYELHTTPHMDRLAEGGVLFERAYSHASFTAPSHASLLTSLHPQSHGVLYWDRRLTPEAPTLQGLFGAAGYRTAAIHNHPGLVPTEITRGFDEVQARYFEPWQTTVEAFFAWTDSGAKAPFAAWLHLWDAHRPYGFRDWRAEYVRPHTQRSGDDLVLAYAEQGFGPQSDRRIGRTEAFYNLRPEQRAAPIDVGGKARVLDAAEWAYISDRYDASVRYADQGVGALLDGLESRGLLDNTVVVLTSDHGEALMERDPVWFTHDPFLTEEVMHVPLILRLPKGQHAGRRIPDLVRGVDVLPTLLELCDVPLRGRVALQGQSMVSLLDGAAPRARTLFGGTQTRSAKETRRSAKPGEEVWFEYRQVLIDGSLKVVHDLELDRWSAFDLAADPGEHRDLLADGAKPSDEVLRRMGDLRKLRENLPVAGRLEVQLTGGQQATLAGLGYTGGDEETPPPPPPPPPKEEDEDEDKDENNSTASSGESAAGKTSGDRSP